MLLGMILLYLWFAQIQLVGIKVYPIVLSVDIGTLNLKDWICREILLHCCKMMIYLMYIYIYTYIFIDIYIYIGID